MTMSFAPTESNETEPLIMDSELLGKGSLAYVFRGVFRDNTDVAIKRSQKANCEEDHIKKISDEIENLKALEKHDNIAAYLYSFFDKDFFYIVTELCHGTLIDLFDEQNSELDIPNNYDSHQQVYFKLKLVQDIAVGLNYLHEAGIIHGDLSPKNVLLKTEKNTDSRQIRALLCDFGLSIKPDDDDVGEGWKPKELILKGRIKIIKFADVFAFGCLVHFILTHDRNEGSIHPFGNGFVRVINILSDKRTRYLFDKRVKSRPAKCDMLLADILVDLCITSTASERPSTGEILRHPLFWSSERKVQFVCKIFNKFNPHGMYRSAPEVQELEARWRDLQFERYGMGYAARHLNTFWERYDKKPEDGSEATLFFFMRLVQAVRKNYKYYEASLESGYLTLDSDENIARYFFNRVAPSFPTIYIAFYHGKNLDEYFYKEAENVSVKQRKSWASMLRHFVECASSNQTSPGVTPDVVGLSTESGAINH